MILYSLILRSCRTPKISEEERLEVGGVCGEGREGEEEEEVGRAWWIESREFGGYVSIRDASEWTVRSWLKVEVTIEGEVTWRWR